MVRAGGIIIHLAPDRRRPLLEAFDMSGRIAEVVPEFAHSRNAPLIAFLCFDDGKVMHLARARRGMRAAHELSRLNLDDMTKLPKPVAISDIVEAVPLRIRRHAEARLTGGGLLSPTSFTAVVEAVRSLSDASRPLLDRFSATRRGRIARLGTDARRGLAFQKESVATALAMAGLAARAGATTRGCKATHRISTFNTTSSVSAWPFMPAEDLLTSEYMLRISPFTVRRRVRWSECDPAGVVFAVFSRSASPLQSTGSSATSAWVDPIMSGRRGHIRHQPRRGA